NIDNRHHFAAMLDDAFHPRRHVGHAIGRRVAKDPVHRQDVSAEQVQSQLKGDELYDVRVHVRSPCVSPAAIAASISASASRIAINSEPRRTTPTMTPSDASTPGADFTSVASTRIVSYSMSIARPTRRSASSPSLSRHSNRSAASYADPSTLSTGRGS